MKALGGLEVGERWIGGATKPLKSRAAKLFVQAVGLVVLEYLFKCLEDTFLWTRSRLPLFTHYTAMVVL